MKPLLLGLLLLPGGALAPPAARVTLTPLTRAAYERARQLASLAREARTFPVRKIQGKIRVTTAAGTKLFRDKVGREETDNVIYTYLGYVPRVRVHLVGKSYWEAEEALLNVVLVVRPDGRILQLPGEPHYSLSQRLAVVYWSFPNFDEGITATVQLLVPQATTAPVLWESTSEAWEPVAAFWESDSTVCLKRRYRHPARFTYARLLVR
jgi:hypothetical protein